MVTKEKNPKIRALTEIANFVENMVMWGPNFLRMESKCFKNMEFLEVVMKKHNINIDYSSANSSSHGHALSVDVL
jgi:hypothetical protein